MSNRAMKSLPANSSTGMSPNRRILISWDEWLWVSVSLSQSGSAWGMSSAKASAGRGMSGRGMSERARACVRASLWGGKRTSSVCAPLCLSVRASGVCVWLRLCLYLWWKRF